MNKAHRGARKPREEIKKIPEIINQDLKDKSTPEKMNKIKIESLQERLKEIEEIKKIIDK